VSALSDLSSIGQENLVRAMVEFSLGMVSNVVNLCALSLGQSLMKEASPADNETSSISSSLVSLLVAFSSARLLSLSLRGYNARAQLIWGFLGGLPKKETVCETPPGSVTPTEIRVYSKPRRAW